MNSSIAERMAAFAKPINDTDTGLAKTAGPIDFLARNAKPAAQWVGRRMGMGGGGARPPTPPPPRVPPPPAPGGMGLGKKLAIGGGLAAGGTAGTGAAAVGYGHLQDHAANSPEWNANPLTWGRSSHPSREDIFRRNNATYESMSGDLNNQIVEAMGRGDHAKADSLKQQLESGEFGGGGRGGDWYNPMSWNSPTKWRMGGLNPFATQNASYYRDNALSQQDALQGEYNRELGNSGMQPGDKAQIDAIKQRMASGRILPSQAAALEKQLAVLEQRMSAEPGAENDAAKQIRERMLGSGMRVNGAKPTGTTGLPGGGDNYYNFPKRPGAKPPAPTMNNPYDFRRDPFIGPWEETLAGDSGYAGNIRGR